MSKLFGNITGATLLALAVLSSAQASVVDYNYVVDAAGNSALDAATSAPFGLDLPIGGSLTVDFKTQVGYAFSSQTFDSIWGIIGMDGCGDRNADFSYSFLYHGAVVNSGNVNQSFSCVHMGPFLQTGVNGLFDEYQWTGTLLSSTSLTNVTSSWGLVFHDSAVVQDIQTSAVVQDVQTNVPEPASLALLGLGLVGLAASRRKTA